MRYSILSDIYEKLEKTTKKLEKRDILAEFYKKSESEDISIVIKLSMGTIKGEKGTELGVARQLMKEIIRKTYGIPSSEVSKKFNSTGDLGLTAEFFCKNRRQKTLSSKILSIRNVYENLKKLPEITGSGTVDKKIKIVSELLSHSKPKEARYIVRTVLGDLRIGVAEGIVRDAISKAFNKNPKEIERAYDVTGDYGKVAQMARKGKIKAEIVLGVPVRVMLAERSPSLKEALDKFSKSSLEIKYDGFRIAIHKDGKKIKLFSRRLEEVTKQFPDIVALAKKNIKAKSCIIEGETLAIDSEGKPKPFQTLSRRIQRKYDVDIMTKKVPIQINLFDLIYYNGKNYMNKKAKERWAKLKSILKQKEGKFQLAEHIETKDIKKAQKFYDKALKLGQEGLMIKNLDAFYQPGRRVGYWLKVKPIMEPLDLVIIGAQWGEGKRAKFLGSLILACKSGNEFLATGMMGSGLTDKQLSEITKKLKSLIIREKANRVEIKPKIVIEVAYEEIQKSPKYPSGYALRFPRLLRFREKEKKPSDINSKYDIEKLFFQQKRKH